MEREGVDSVELQYIFNSRKLAEEYLAKEDKPFLVLKEAKVFEDLSVDNSIIESFEEYIKNESDDSECDATESDIY